MAHAAIRSSGISGGKLKFTTAGILFSADASERLTAKSPIRDPVVLMMFLRSPYFQGQLRSLVVGTPVPKSAIVTQVFELILASLRVRADYPTRVWTALAVPSLAGTLLGWSTRKKLEGLLLGVLLSLFYTIACIVWKKYLR